MELLYPKRSSVPTGTELRSGRTGRNVPRVASGQGEAGIRTPETGFPVQRFLVPLLRLELSFFDLVEGQLLGDRAAREAGQVGSPTDVSARPFERPA
jgi:hypothetical protein